MPTSASSNGFRICTKICSQVQESISTRCMGGARLCLNTGCPGTEKGEAGEAGEEGEEGEEGDGGEKGIWYRGRESCMYHGGPSL